MQTRNHQTTLTLGIGIIAAAVYIAAMGIGMYVMHNVFGGTYGDVSMLPTMVWVEVVLSLIGIFFVIRYSNWRAIGFGKTQWKHVLWLLPSAVLMFTVWPPLFAAFMDHGSLGTIGLIALTTLLVGFSEELMFRGILLRGALTQMGIFASILISAIGFSLLHAVNVFGGAPAVGIPFQLVLTFLAGLFFAPVALKLRNLAPLMVFHWLWDFTTLSTSYLGVNSAYLGFGIAGIEIVLIIILFVLMRKESPETVKITV